MEHRRQSYHDLMALDLTPMETRAERYPITRYLVYSVYPKLLTSIGDLLDIPKRSFRLAYYPRLGAKKEALEEVYVSCLMGRRHNMFHQGHEKSSGKLRRCRPVISLSGMVRAQIR
jgi:hypothetical protein